MAVVAGAGAAATVQCSLRGVLRDRVNTLSECERRCGRPPAKQSSWLLAAESHTDDDDDVRAGAPCVVGGLGQQLAHGTARPGRSTRNTADRCRIIRSPPEKV